MEQLRQLPSTERLASAVTQALADEPHALVIEAARSTLERARQSMLQGGILPTSADLEQEVIAAVEALVRPTLIPVINATGVIVHTNLGRALLSTAALDAMRRIGAGYSNLEFDLASGTRGSRTLHAEILLARLTGAEAALIVNNNAAAVMLVMAALARDRQVLVSRGQLVEIGGGFRIPDVLRQSGAHLVEVGTTNRTYARDYLEATTPETAMILSVHYSNFRLQGFVHQPELSELAAVARDNNLILVEDLGSGCLLDTLPYGLSHEPTVQESIAAGAHLVCFSGDKLFGGPQAGIIVGTHQLLTAVKRHPLVRALRVDKMTFAGIQATLLHYLRGEAETQVPVWRMIAASLESLMLRVQHCSAVLSAAGIDTRTLAGESTVGGGSLPGETMPTLLLALPHAHPQDLARRLRQGQPAVVPRIQDGMVVFDLRTVLPDEDAILVRAILSA
ncbi:MAG: L-seryl-tRNA(Sec) selenium transferase [Chloroflexi bacterium]|nr:L-seryl-tRNA(Sec) selenium transferase [Chloroflexota bacterium]